MTACIERYIQLFQTRSICTYVSKDLLSSKWAYIFKNPILHIVLNRLKYSKPVRLTMEILKDLLLGTSIQNT